MSGTHTLAELLERWWHGPDMADAKTPEGLREVVGYLAETQGWEKFLEATAAVAESHADNQLLKGESGGVYWATRIASVFVEAAR